MADEQPELTERQEEILCYIEGHWNRFGCSPSHRDIARRFRFASPNAAACHLDALAKKGAIQLPPKGTPRGIRVVRKRSYLPYLGQIGAGPLSPAFELEHEQISLDELLCGADSAALVADDSLPGVAAGSYALCRAGRAVAFVQLLERIGRPGCASDNMLTLPEFAGVSPTD